MATVPTPDPVTPTKDLAEWVAGQTSADIGVNAITWAKHALLDWFGVTLGGSKDPLVQILIDDALEEGEGGESRLVGRSERVISARAALINGAASHALDFDDVNQKMTGHPTVTVAPAVLAVAEQRNLNGREVIEGFVIGYESACHVGEMMGGSHYEKGWHATATVGTFGAAAAGARLLGLDAGKNRDGVGNCRYSGLWSQVHVRHHVQTVTRGPGRDEWFIGGPLGGQRVYQQQSGIGVQPGFCRHSVDHLCLTTAEKHRRSTFCG